MLTLVSLMWIHYNVFNNYYYYWTGHFHVKTLVNCQLTYTSRCWLLSRYTGCVRKGRSRWFCRPLLKTQNASARWVPQMTTTNVCVVFFESPEISSFSMRRQKATIEQCRDNTVNHETLEMCVYVILANFSTTGSQHTLVRKYLSCSCVDRFLWLCCNQLTDDQIIVYFYFVKNSLKMVIRRTKLYQ